MKNRTIATMILAVFFAAMLGCAWFFAFQAAMSADCHGIQGKTPDCDNPRNIASSILHHFLVFSQVQHTALLLLFAFLMGLIFFLASRLSTALNAFDFTRQRNLWRAQAKRAVSQILASFRNFLSWHARHFAKAAHYRKRDPYMLAFDCAVFR